MAEVGSVLIVGGGIAGLSLATALGNDGVRVELVERSPDWPALGGGLLVQGNAMRVLRRLGLDAAVAAAGTVVCRWVFADQQGEVLSETDLTALWGEVGPCVGIARAGLQRVLVEGASAVPCRLGTSISSLAEGDRQVQVAFTDGTVGAYDLVVGADGIHSAVRNHVAGAIAPTFARQIVWRSLAPFRLPGPASVQMWLGDGSFFGMCAVGGGTTYGFGNVTHPREHDPVEGRLARLRDRFAGYGRAVQDYLGRLESDQQIHCSPIEWLDQQQWHTGRVLLIGDAAHASSPMMGQGGCLAIEDAWVLAQVLRAEPTVERALAAYDDRRRARVTWVQQQSRAVADSFQLPPQVRNQALRDRGPAMLQHRFAQLREQP